MRFITSVYCILYISEQEHAYEMKAIEAERHFLSYASTIQRNFHQQCIGLLGHATGSLALVLPLIIMHLCGAKTAWTDTPLFTSCSVSSSTVNYRVIRLFADPTGLAILGVGLLASWKCGFESRLMHVSLSPVGTVCCRVEVSATG
jgi:hypothetical protein